MDSPPLIVHIIYRLGVGGLENGLVNLINTMPIDAYRHAIVCLKDDNDLSQRLTRNDVSVYSLHKMEGQDWGSFVRFYRLLKQLKPAIVHTRNLATIEYQIPAFLAGISYRVHGEHGWDVFDPNGENKKYQWVRRLIKPLIHRFIPLSKQLESYLTDKIHVSPDKITRIINGVDNWFFYPLTAEKQPLAGCPLVFSDDDLIIGTIGRMHGVKDQLTLVNAFIQLCQRGSELKSHLKLIIIGDGPLREPALKLLTDNQLAANAWLPGERADVAEIMRRLDLFVLPSQAEGISNTILEAMATGLPVLATSVGGNPELVAEGITGMLTPAGDSAAMAEKLSEYIHNTARMREHGQQGLQRAAQEFSLTAMVANYQAVYDSFFQQE
ncbi:MAG: TIGR03088 family PEP-CTERM/XrtA system glycosyltransferase [Methylovulum sp.]|nr:TIGR03088 family PEP-CTERM/XrtA system glycosyltransferase [Methylovulum sp.]